MQNTENRYKTVIKPLGEEYIGYVYLDDPFTNIFCEIRKDRDKLDKTLCEVVTSLQHTQQPYMEHQTPT